MNKAESKYFNTAVRIDEAFIALLEKKDFDYITVKEICEKAGINRSTFYLHYETIGDLLHESIEYMNRKCFASFHGKDASPVIGSGSVEDLILVREEYLTPYLTFVKDNKSLFRTAVTKSSVLNGADTFAYISKNIIAPILMRFHYPADEIGYVTAFYVNGLIAVVMEWIKNDCREEIPMMIGIIHKVTLPNGNGVLSLEQARFIVDSKDARHPHSGGTSE